MITANMNHQELLNEIKKDLSNIIQISNNKDVKVRRIILKSTLFPVFLHSFVTSPRKNKWVLLWEARSKKNVGDSSLITFVCYIETTHGRYAYLPTWTDGNLLLIVYPPHFFSRFASRMKLNLTGIDLIKRYFERNHNYTYSYDIDVVNEEKLHHVYGSGQEGIAMGIKDSNSDIVLFKTFITYEMCKGQQIDVFVRNESIRKEIHEIETIGSVCKRAE